MIPKRPAGLLITVVSLLSVIVLAGCNSPAGTPTPELEPSAQVSPVNSPTPVPTAEPAAIWLVSGPGENEDLRLQFSAWMAAQAQQDGFVFTEFQEFRSSEVPSELKVVVYISPPDDISNLAANLSDTQFVVVNSESVSTAANLSVIDASIHEAAFLAGYLATLTAPDFRSGALFVDGIPGSAELQESFLNGGRYFCGRCSPVYAPLIAFPVTGVVPAGADAAGWQAAFDTIHQNRIEMLYLPAAGLQPEFLEYLREKNIGILSSAPPPPDYESIWIASVTSDPLAALETLWPDLIAGSGGKQVNAEIKLTHVNPDNLSIGRQEMAEKLIPELSAGLIAPLSNP